MLKPLERLAKTLLAWLAAVFLWRPARRRRAQDQLAGARRVLLIRIDSRVGEALLTTPLVQALAQVRPDMAVDLLVHPRCASLLQGCPGAGHVLPFSRRRLWLGPLSPGIRALRRARYDTLIDCSNWTAPSVTSALVARLSAPRATVIGPAQGFLRMLRDVAVPARSDTQSEVLQRLHLLSPLLTPVPPAPLAFRSVQDADVDPGISALIQGGPFAVINPGGRLGWRRVPTALFATAARRLLQSGVRVVVTWGPGEEPLAREVAYAAPGALLAPPTSLDALAWLLAHAQLAVCNNTGPMHLAVAVKTPTLGLFLRMDPARWGHVYPPHRMVDLTPALEAGATGDAELTAALELLLSRR